MFDARMPSQKKPLVLVADDSDEMREMVTSHLQQMTDPAFDVIEASDGEQAIALAKRNKPDLVVLDVMMPEVSGWEVCKKIREDASLAHTGVVILTGIGETLNTLTSPLYGADAYIDKPFDFEQFDAKVRSALLARAVMKNGVVGPAKAATKKAATKKAAAGPGVKKAAPKSAKKKPVAKKPVAKKPAAKKPVAKKPAAKKPVATKQAVAKKPVAKKKIVAKKPVAKKQAVAKKPMAKNKPVAKKSKKR